MFLLKDGARAEGSTPTRNRCISICRITPMHTRIKGQVQWSWEEAAQAIIQRGECSANACDRNPTDGVHLSNNLKYYYFVRFLLDLKTTESLKRYWIMEIIDTRVGDQENDPPRRKVRHLICFPWEFRWFKISISRLRFLRYMPLFEQPCV